MSTPDTELHPCACGCGELVPKKWKRGHSIRGEGGFSLMETAKRRTGGVLGLLPGPDVADDDLEDFGILEPDEDILEEPAPVPRQHAGAGPGEDWEPEPDPEPAHLNPEKGKRTRQPTTRPVRVTASVRRDVEAKIRFVAVPAGRMWAARDQVCGGTFVEQEPEISSALAEIVCDSPDLLNWFTGPSGKYMKFFNLFMAALPVGMAVTSHHLVRHPEQAEDFQAPDYSQYAA
jgi:hypothetical protein